MRSRNIKPGFFKNYQLGTNPYEVRLLFAGLWLLADKRGRLEYQPMRIKAELFPYDSITEHQMISMLDKLESGAFILKYESNGIRYIQVTKFENHQHPHIREQDSSIPSPCKARSGTRTIRLIPDSLIPDSLIPDSLKTDGIAAPDDIRAAFDSVWRDYPKRLGRKGAYTHYLATVKTDVDLKRLRIALAKYNRHVYGKDRQYIQHGSTWFNNWRDWVDFEEETNASNGGKGVVDYAAIARAKRELEKVRKDPSVGPVPTGFGNLSDHEAKTNAIDRRELRGVTADVSGVGPAHSLEDEQDRGKGP